MMEEEGMKKNMGTADRIVRVVAAAAAAALIVTGVLQGAAAIVAGVLAGIFLLTSAVAVCPLYLPFGISTKGKDD